MKGDLVVLVADGGIEQAIQGLLTRTIALGIRPLSRVEFPKFKPLDSGAFAHGAALVQAYGATHAHALVVFDAAWEGHPSEAPAELERQVEQRLTRDWGRRARCVVIDPELEIWVWSDSPHVASALGWDSMPELKAWLTRQGLWEPTAEKPGDPKKAYRAALGEKRIPPSNSIFHELAQKVSVQRCRDQAYLRLVQILRDWFPASSAAAHKS